MKPGLWGGEVVKKWWKNEVAMKCILKEASRKIFVKVYESLIYRKYRCCLVSSALLGSWSPRVWTFFSLSACMDYSGIHPTQLKAGGWKEWKNINQKGQVDKKNTLGNRSPCRVPVTLRCTNEQFRLGTQMIQTAKALRCNTCLLYSTFPKTPRPHVHSQHSSPISNHLSQHSSRTLLQPEVFKMCPDVPV